MTYKILNGLTSLDKDIYLKAEVEMTGGHKWKLIKETIRRDVRKCNSLVIENNIGFPDSLEREAYDVDATEVGGVPGKMSVRPDLRHPAVGGEDLVPLVLGR